MAKMDLSVDRSGPQSTPCESVPQLGDLGSRHEPNEDWIPISELWVEASDFAGMVLQSPQMLTLARYLSRIAPYKATVLIQGESGTGKELVAQALGRLGPAPN